MKIIKLLNEFEKEKTGQNIVYWSYYQNGFHYLEYGQSYSELLIISKGYKFIKWLIDNNKVDRDIVDDNFTRPFYGYTNYEIVLMLLSISETPIADLILYLK